MQQDQTWASIIHKWSRIQQTCARCGAVFFEIDNIGLWKCKQHPMSLDGDLKYRCCGISVYNRTPKSIGCVPCDHSSDGKIYIDSDVVTVPKVYMDLMKPMSKTILDPKKILDLPNNKMTAFVSRFDRDLTQKIIDTKYSYSSTGP